MNISTVFKESEHHLIANGCSNASDRYLIISTRPPDMAGAVRSASHITGIMPMAQRIRFCLRLSAGIATPLSTPLGWGFYGAQKKFINVLSRTILLKLFVSQIVESMDYDSMLEVIKGQHSLFLFPIDYLAFLSVRC